MYMKELYKKYTNEIIKIQSENRKVVKLLANENEPCIQIIYMNIIEYNTIMFERLTDLIFEINKIFEFN